jgi:hypothetical protein
MLLGACSALRSRRRADRSTRLFLAYRPARVGMDVSPDARIGLTLLGPATRYRLLAASGGAGAQLLVGLAPPGPQRPDGSDSRSSSR